MLYTCRTDDEFPFYYDIPLANGDYEIAITTQDEKWRMFRGDWGGRGFWIFAEGDRSEPFDYVDVFGRFALFFTTTNFPSNILFCVLIICFA